MLDLTVFVIAAAVVLGGAVGVIASRNPVRAALSLIASFFGVAVLFVIQEAHFLALVQVVVYAGAIVVLFLFVIMLLGVDRSEDLSVEPLAGQRLAGIGVGVLVLALVLGGLFLSGPGGDEGAVALTGSQGATRPLIDAAEQSDVNQLAVDLFTRNILAFEATALLLTIATVGAVVLVRNRTFGGSPAADTGTGKNSDNEAAGPSADGVDANSAGTDAEAAAKQVLAGQIDGGGD